jgi:adenine-specific DNA-methyltransferase
VFRKAYASSVRLLRYQHELAYPLAKGFPKQPACPIPDVIDFRYTGNRLHPTEKPVSALLPQIGAFSNEGDLVLDPFCGSESTLVAARQLRRRSLGIELDSRYQTIAADRLQPQAA